MSGGHSGATGRRSRLFRALPCRIARTGARIAGGHRRSLTIDAKTLAAALAHACHEKKAEDIVVLDVAERIGLTDYFVLVTGLNRNHVRSLANELHVRSKALGAVHRRLEGEGLYWWVVMDCGDVVVHVLQPEARAYYEIEHLYADCARLNWESIPVSRSSDLSAAEA